MSINNFFNYLHMKKFFFTALMCVVALSMSAEAQEHSKTYFGKMSNYAAFVEAHIDIDRKSSEKRVYSSGLTSNISNHTRGFDAAARDAYKKITPMIIEILTKQLGLGQEVR